MRRIWYLLDLSQGRVVETFGDGGRENLETPPVRAEAAMARRVDLTGSTCALAIGKWFEQPDPAPAELLEAAKRAAGTGRSAARAAGELADMVPAPAILELLEDAAAGDPASRAIVVLLFGSVGGPPARTLGECVDHYRALIARNAVSLVGGEAGNVAPAAALGAPAGDPDPSRAPGQGSPSRA